VDSTAHSLVEVNGQDLGPHGKGQRITAQARAQIDDHRTRESSGFVPGDRFRSGLLDSGRLDPHPLAALELHPRFLAGPRQANGGGNSRGRGQLAQSLEIRRQNRSNFGDLLEQAATGEGGQDPGLGFGGLGQGARGLLD